MTRPLWLPRKPRVEDTYSGPWPGRSWAASVLIRTAGALIDTARYLLGSRP